MQYVPFGKTGEQVSAMCLGTMMFGDRCDEAESDRILSMALDAGVNFIDTAWSYAQGRTEEILGRILRGRRDKVFLVTKVTQRTDGAWIRQSLEESLTRLQTDHVDLYLIHWPRPHMRPREMMEALNDLVVAGKTRYVGCSNFPAWLVAHFNAIALQEGWAPLVCNQVPYNLIERGIEVEVLPQAVAEQIAITTYRPLLMGILAGKYGAGEVIPEDSRGAVDPRIPVWLEKFREGLGQFQRFAAERGLHPAQVAIAWARHTPGVTAPIVGVSSHRQLETSLGAFDVTLSPEEYRQLADFFGAEVKEESGGNFPKLRRALDLVEPE